ncbi:MAG: OadG family protein [Bacteroidales bacterium]|jgi:Na+-transporting methylmalonyl-CoA/oxaloacetate decarboxylase gamma subunit|nr:OadG family protein [Bacteroidales bacterium]
MKHLNLFLAVVGLTLCLTAGAQSQDAMRLNEYLVVNTDDFQDDFGQQNAWIELFNSSYGTVDIAGCFLSDDPANLKKYAIPGGDLLTKIKPRQHVLFWADNQPYRGTFHVSFDLANAKEIIFTKGDGKTIIDRIPVKHDLGENVTYGRLEDGIGSVDGSGQGWAVMDRTSPSTNNSLIDKAAKPDRMKALDPYGWILALTAMSVVFLALILLYFIFKAIGNANIRAGKKRAAAVAGTDVKDSQYGEVPGEVYAAIATAMHLYQEDGEGHDEESFVVTLHHTDRTYSPWSSKIYTLRQTPTVNKRR